MTNPSIAGLRPGDILLDVQADAAQHHPAKHRPVPIEPPGRMEPRTPMNERPAA